MVRVPLQKHSKLKQFVAAVIDRTEGVAFVDAVEGVDLGTADLIVHLELMTVLGQMEEETSSKSFAVSIVRGAADFG
jgi:hypothetical protein